MHSMLSILSFKSCSKSWLPFHYQTEYHVSTRHSARYVKRPFFIWVDNNSKCMSTFSLFSSFVYLKHTNKASFFFLFWFFVVVCWFVFWWLVGWWVLLYFKDSKLGEWERTVIEGETIWDFILILHLSSMCFNSNHLLPETWSVLSVRTLNELFKGLSFELFWSLNKIIFTLRINRVPNT